MTSGSRTGSDHDDSNDPTPFCVSRKINANSCGPAYGAGANEHDTACAIKTEIYNNINIIIYNIFTTYITDTKVGQVAKKKRDQKF